MSGSVIVASGVLTGDLISVGDLAGGDDGCGLVNVLILCAITELRTGFSGTLVVL